MRSIGLCQPACHVHGEIPFDGLEVDHDVPGKSFASELTKPAQDALARVRRADRSRTVWRDDGTGPSHGGNGPRSVAGKRPAHSLDTRVDVDHVRGARPRIRLTIRL